MPKKKPAPEPPQPPASCHPGAVPDLFAIWNQLVTLWQSQVEGRTSKQLAEELAVLPQKVSQWKTGSAGTSPPPWHLVMRVAWEVGVVVVIDPVTGTRLHRATVLPPL